jgi:hypothetical protein
MGLMPGEFWSLTYREFNLKHAAFIRAEDRHRALVMELASMTGMFTDKAVRKRLDDNVAILRRYPLKPWR